MIRSTAAIRAIGLRICLLRQPTRVSAGKVAKTNGALMKYRLAVALSAVILLTLGVGLTFAHHSATATYIYGKSVKIEGTLKEFIWRNPHSFMKVQAPDEKGEMQTWVIEGAAAAVLAESGVTT